MRLEGLSSITTGLVAVIVGIPLLDGRPSPRPECEIAREWVAAHPDDLPKTLRAFSEHSAIYRRHIYTALALQTRRDLWHEHFAKYVGTESLLSGSQRALLTSVDDRLEDLLADTGAVSRLKPSLKATFPGSLYRSVFVVLGPEPLPDQPASYALGKLGARLAADDCTCAFSDDCSAGTPCCYFNPFCFPVDGCGPLGLYRCEGYCQAC